jgi:cell division protein FtsW (lipid II flippase)
MKGAMLSLDITELIFGDSAAILANITRYLLPLVALVILFRCIRSMLRERFEPETWAYLYLPGEIMVPLRHWECILGRARSVDGQIDHPSVGKLHACLIRSASGQWTVYNLGKGITQVNGQTVAAGGLPISDADVLTLGDVPARFVDLTEEERASLLKYRRKPGRLVRPGGTFFYLTVFQIFLTLQQLVYNPDATSATVMAFGALCLIQWVYFAVLRASGQRGFEIEILGFFLTSVGLSIACSSLSLPTSIMKQVVFILAGVLLFLFLGIWMRDLKRMKTLRLPAMVAALVFLVLNLVLAEVTNGAQNWVEIGGFRFQPSEFVKILYIYAGAATLDRLFVNRNLIFYIGFSAACVGALALMSDFGTALVFFVTFLVISFMRSGSFATVFLAIAAAALGVMLVLTVKPYVIARFQTWGHVWEDVYDTGWQQAQAMCAAASGGLFGQGAGNGWLVDITAGDTDMVFAAVSEELGLIVALCCVASLIAMAAFVVKNASSGRSSYFVIAASAAISMMISQMALNVFGTMDILPFTGVTFPFVSRGGSSLISCWMLLAFIKGCDMRANASFAVKRPERFSGGAGVEDVELYDDDDDNDDWHREPQY